MKRREFVAQAAVFSAAALAAPYVIGSARAASNELSFVGFGGDYQLGQTKAFFEPFEKATGIKIVQSEGVDLAKLRAQVESGDVEWDFLSLPDRLRYTAVHDGLLMPLDYNVIDTHRVEPSLVTQYAVGGVTIPMLLTYSMQHYAQGKAPMTWPQFWDIGAFPGQHGMYNGRSVQPGICADRRRRAKGQALSA